MATRAAAMPPVGRVSAMVITTAAPAERGTVGKMAMVPSRGMAEETRKPRMVGGGVGAVKGGGAKGAPRPGAAVSRLGTKVEALFAKRGAAGAAMAAWGGGRHAP